MRYQPVSPLQLLQNHTKCRSSVLIILKNKTYQINVSDILGINTAGKTRLYKHACSHLPSGHAQVETRTSGIFPRFPQVKRVNTNITNKHQKPELARRLLVLRRGSWHHPPPPLIFDSSTCRDSTQHSHYPVLILESSQIKTAILLSSVQVKNKKFRLR